MIEAENKVFARPRCWKGRVLHYCPGCHHGLVHRLLGQAIDHYELAGRAVGVIGVGCSVFLYDYLNVDMCEAAHGRAPAVATGIKRVNPQNFVFTYQGDGDLAAIGLAEIMHAANRGEKITVIFVNNGNYGMTGGQMAPTTIIGQKTTTTPRGRSAEADGMPLKIAELLGSLEGAGYVARVACYSPAQVRQAQKAIFRACEMQVRGEGFSLVEVLSACPTNWGVPPLQALKMIEEQMTEVFPLGVFKDSGAK